ncbi:MAG: chlorite dismutase family protein [Acidobacteria bacterium]|nr:chlorite dismutase family protein [Acidobacteriota bacterium]
MEPTDHLEKFTPDLVETGAPQQGVPQTLAKRLFCQLHVFTGCLDTAPAVEAVRRSGLDAAVYADVNDPRGIGVLVMSQDPDVFSRSSRELLARAPFAALTPLPDFTMMGRTYALGRERDLADWLLNHPRRNALAPSNRWAVWYPLRRTGAFNRLTRQEQGRIMAEHASIGRGYGEAGMAADIRLECHGLDRDDNEFVLGIVGPELYPLSKLIKDMRGTRQTSEFIQSMGPFFIGRTIFQSPIPESAKAPAGY